MGAISEDLRWDGWERHVEGELVSGEGRMVKK